MPQHADEPYHMTMLPQEWPDLPDGITALSHLRQLELHSCGTRPIPG